MAQRILLADDAPAVRQGVKALLEGEGFEVVGEAENGQEAVRLAQALRPDVAILDLSMPELSGLDAAREIQQLCPWTHLILLTVYTEEHHIITALRAGIRGYVVKAEAADDLARAIGWVSRGGIFLSPTACRVVIDVYLSKDNYPLRLAPPVACGLYGFCPAAESEETGPTPTGQ